MLKFDNTHIFTGYLKQLLATFNLPTCKVYTRQFAEYQAEHGIEDPRIVESFDNIKYNHNGRVLKHGATRVNYLKSNEIYNYMVVPNRDEAKLDLHNVFWKQASNIFYTPDKRIPGLTRRLNSPGNLYDTDTHEYIGDYLRFIRDYYNLDLMSMYNCFNNKLCSNIYYKHKVKTIVSDSNKTRAGEQSDTYRLFDAKDSNYRIYAIPVKLFSDYTVAIDCSHEIEMFCGFYKSTLDTASKAIDLIEKTYVKYNKTLFCQPFLYDKLNVKYWNLITDCEELESSKYPRFLDTGSITRWDILNREQDLRLFIKIPASCSSSITILEGDYRNFNDFSYRPVSIEVTIVIDGQANVEKRVIWEYTKYHSVINFGDNIDLNAGTLKPISKLQLLAFNTGESYPFADRLIEYLSGSVISSVEEIPDNIKRAQKVMSQNQHYFKINGVWEDKMQKILYDYMMNSGPIEVVKDSSGKTKLIDSRHGQHPRLGYTSNSSTYDILGFVDRETEKYYASWTKENNSAKVRNTIQNVDIYNGLYNI